MAHMIEEISNTRSEGPKIMVYCVASTLALFTRAHLPHCTAVCGQLYQCSYQLKGRASVTDSHLWWRIQLELFVCWYCWWFVACLQQPALWWLVSSQMILLFFFFFQICFHRSIADVANEPRMVVFRHRVGLLRSIFNWVLPLNGPTILTNNCCNYL